MNVLICADSENKAQAFLIHKIYLFISMFGYWENEAEEKSSLTGFERGKIEPDQSVLNSFWFGPVHILKKSQLLLRLDFLTQTGQDHEHLYRLPLS